MLALFDQEELVILFGTVGDDPDDLDWSYPKEWADQWKDTSAELVGNPPCIWPIVDEIVSTERFSNKEIAEAVEPFADLRTRLEQPGAKPGDWVDLSKARIVPYVVPREEISGEELH